MAAGLGPERKIKETLPLRTLVLKNLPWVPCTNLNVGPYVPCLPQPNSRPEWQVKDAAFVCRHRGAMEGF